MDSEQSMGCSYSHGREFVQEVRPILDTGDLDVLLGHLSRYWSAERLTELLSCPHDDAVKIAVFCLSLIGNMSHATAIGRLLQADDPYVVNLAENAMWTIWFRASDEQGNALLRYAVRLIGESRLGEAVNCLSDLIARRPNFAEAYNQRAIDHFLSNDYPSAIRDCRHTLRLNPYHFGAMAGLGHCFAAMGRLNQALAAYRCTLWLHPRLEGIQRTIREVRRSLQQPHAHGGSSQSAAT
jgi:tetratricopeptide (TPR) repeat protein